MPLRRRRCRWRPRHCVPQIAPWQRSTLSTLPCRKVHSGACASTRQTLAHIAHMSWQRTVPGARLGWAGAGAASMPLRSSLPRSALLHRQPALQQCSALSSVRASMTNDFCCHHHERPWQPRPSVAQGCNGGATRCTTHILARATLAAAPPPPPPPPPPQSQPRVHCAPQPSLRCANRTPSRSIMQPRAMRSAPPGTGGARIGTGTRGK